VLPFPIAAHRLNGFLEAKLGDDRVRFLCKNVQGPMRKIEAMSSSKVLPFNTSERIQGAAAWLPGCLTLLRLGL
jgi:hypothetical protein